MSEKIYLHFLVLCGILSQGIIATLSNEDNKESSDLLVRRRRVINHNPGGIATARMEDANYIVNIQKNFRAHCAGAILSHYSVITALSCINMQTAYYRVLSGARFENRGLIHNITSKSVKYGNPAQQFRNGIALISIDPPFVFTARVGYISLYEGPLRTGTRVTVSGWGCSYTPRPGPTTRRALRSITLPIMNHEECQNVYRDYFAILNIHICTYDERQYCAYSDTGAPLVVNNMLAGIHVWKGEHVQEKNPDVFINLQHPDFSQWIKDNTLLM